jgi:putative oxidoreductase
MELKIVALIARLLLGLVFLVFGLNGFLHFINAPLPSGIAGQFLSALMQSHFVLIVSAVQVAGGALLLANRYVPWRLYFWGLSL